MFLQQIIKGLITSIIIAISLGVLYVVFFILYANSSFYDPKVNIPYLTDNQFIRDTFNLDRDDDLELLIGDPLEKHISCTLVSQQTTDLNSLIFNCSKEQNILNVKLLGLELPKEEDENFRRDASLFFDYIGKHYTLYIMTDEDVPQAIITKQSENINELIRKRFDFARDNN